MIQVIKKRYFFNFSCSNKVAAFIYLVLLTLLFWEPINSVRKWQKQTSSRL